MNDPFDQQRTTEMVGLINRLSIVQTIVGTLSKNLDPALVYHSVGHTKAVLEQVVQLAVFDRLAERATILLGIAAAYHDSGFLVQRSDNEPCGAEKARAAMEQEGSFTEQEIACVETLILDTRMHGGVHAMEQRPSMVLSGYLCDADLYNFGSIDFFAQSQLVARELGEDPQALAAGEQRDMLQRHRWHTNAARKLWDEQKQRNLKVLVEQAG